MDQHR
jgi:hypothetical protein